ncbi:hypothetical protein, partial [Bombella apis]
MTQQAVPSPTKDSTPPSWSIDDTANGLSLTIRGDWKALQDDVVQFPATALTSSHPGSGKTLSINPDG